MIALSKRNHPLFFKNCTLILHHPLKTKITDKYIAWLLEHQKNDNTIPIDEWTKRDRLKLLVDWINTSWKAIDQTIINNSFKFCGYGINGITAHWEKFFVVN